MLDFFHHLFSSDFMPHGHCYFWTPSIVWLNVISDALITLAYYSIPLTLMYIVRRRRDVPFPVMYVMFGGFIVACGTTHLMEIWNVWHGTYRLAGVIKAGTALLSVCTAIALVKLVPAALTLRSRKEMAEVNAALAHEVTERKHSEAALEYERYLMRTLMDNLPDRIFFKDLESRFLRNNRAQLGRFGLNDPAQVEGKTDFDFFSEDHARRAYNDDQLVIKTRQPLNTEEEITWPDGRVDWALVTKMPLYDESGRIVGTFGIARDITPLKQAENELRRSRQELEMRVRERTEELARANTALQSKIREHEHAEQALRHSEERIRLVVEASPSALLMVDERGRMTLVNSQTERLFGYPRQELINQPVEMLVPERYRIHHPGMRAGFFSAPAARPMGAGRDLFGIRKNGTEVPIEIGLNPIQTAEGTFVLASIIDITERKRVEESMKDSLREKETLLKEVHHRVKNNLQIISSVLQLQAGHIKDPDALNVFRDGQNRIRSMALIHEKLYQAGNFVQIDFAEYVQSLASMLTRTYLTPACKVKLTQDIQSVSLNLEPAIPFGLILNEAISNSLKHAFRNQCEGNIWVKLRQTADGTLNLSVQDDGLGLPDGFDWENCSSLGLRLMRILAEQLQGVIELRRQPGTTLTLTVPPNRTKESPAAHVS